MRKFAVAVVSVSLLAPLHAARAESAVDPFLTPAPRVPAESGISIGTRAGYALPFGKTSGAQGSELSNSFKGLVPVQIEVGWRFTPAIYAGAHIGYGAGVLGSRMSQACADNGVSCSVSNLRIGVDLAYAFQPAARFSPWVGIGAGFETAKVKGTQGGQTVDISLRGFELAQLMAGFDYRLWPTVRVGPFASFTLAQFTSVVTPVDPVTEEIGATRTFDIQEKGLHGWAQLGLKATLDL